MKHHIFGDYVITGIPNAFNGKTSYWISKRDYVTAYYCFTAQTEAEAAEHLSTGAVKGYIHYFNAQQK